MITSTVNSWEELTTINSTSDLSPYHHHSLLNNSSRPTSRASSILSSSSPSPLPLQLLPSPGSSLSSRHSIRGDLYNSTTLLPPTSSSRFQHFDPDLEAERVRLAKLEQRRSLALNQTNYNVPRQSSEGSIRSVHSFRSVGPSRPKLPGSTTAPVYRPSPLRSTSTPTLATTLVTEAEKKKKRKEMKEEYQKMRATRIEEEKRLAQQALEKYPTQDSPGWFASHFKRSKELPSTTRIAGHGIDDRRSTSQSSATGSSTPSSSPIDDRSHSTVPTSAEDEYLDLAQRPKNEELLEDLSDEMNSFDSPTIDPFRKSMMPGQVPPTPTKQPQTGCPTPKTIGRTLPARINIIKLNRLLDSFKLGGGGGGSQGDTNNNNNDMTEHTTLPFNAKDERRKAKITVVESRSPIPGQPTTPTVINSDTQTGWLGSIKSIRSKARPSRVDSCVSDNPALLLPTGKRRKSISSLFFGNDRDLPPPVPKLPLDIF
ncbi:hypothetical protein VP01_1348g4 [Puccinia sorghi]|uniref:Uncharacterized protein n=1 Tax=Puccinia sorghi TaxID=27349 RepID=A0A0L6VM87_9BASI|nr:hypothetical protein VP01_1348g4 [Puccinia sorghi]